MATRARSSKRCPAPVCAPSRRTASCISRAQLSFGKRPEVELFDLSKDPDCIRNLVKDAAYAPQMAALSEKLFAELKKQQDPRLLGDVFDQYESPKASRERAAKKK